MGRNANFESSVYVYFLLLELRHRRQPVTYTLLYRETQINWICLKGIKALN